MEKAAVVQCMDRVFDQIRLQSKNEHPSTLLDIFRLFLYCLVIDLKHNFPGLQIDFCR